MTTPATAAADSLVAAQVRRRSTQQSSLASSAGPLDISTMPYEPPQPNSSLAPPALTDNESPAFTRAGPVKATSRAYLRLQAVMWRFLMAIGMFLHRLAPPRPRKHTFVRTIPTTVSPTRGSVNLYFYTPRNYNVTKRLGKESTKYPVVVNFHGGGFTIGHPCDDAKWADTIVTDVDAVCVCVEYRLAPEHPFPTAVEDGVDAILYLAKNAHALHLDPSRIAISGFSCGGNLAFTVPMRLHEELDPRAGRESDSQAASLIDGAGSSTNQLLPKPVPSNSTDSDAPAHPTKVKNTPTTVELSSETASVSSVIAAVPKPVAVISWYPSADYTLSRDQRRQTCQREDMELSPMFTTLFDSSYISPADINKSNPFLSPGRAPPALLRDGLPEKIILYTCEWDMLRAEAQNLQRRLSEMGKTVDHTMVEGVPHGWDRSPNPFQEAKGLREHYKNACRGLREVFYGEEARRRSSFAIPLGKVRESLNLTRKSGEPKRVETL